MQSRNFLLSQRCATCACESPRPERTLTCTSPMRPSGPTPRTRSMASSATRTMNVSHLNIARSCFAAARAGSTRASRLDAASRRPRACRHGGHVRPVRAGADDSSAPRHLRQPACERRVARHFSTRHRSTTRHDDNVRAARSARVVPRHAICGSRRSHRGRVLVADVEFVSLHVPVRTEQVRVIPDGRSLRCPGSRRHAIVVFRPTYR